VRINFGARINARTGRGLPIDLLVPADVVPITRWPTR
jgi:hypothetical protein